MSEISCPQLQDSDLKELLDKMSLFSAVQDPTLKLVTVQAQRSPSVFFSRSTAIVVVSFSSTVECVCA